MVTEVVMVRKLGNCEVRQKSKSAFLCGTDIVDAGNILRNIIY